MGKNLPPEVLYQFIVADFVDGWNSVAQNQLARGRGNFMFARQAMMLLEWAVRLCVGDASGVALRDLSQALTQVEPRYFNRLPGNCADFSEFELPSSGPQPQAQLLWALFDLIRNGQAHQYQQILVHLTDGVDFQVQLTGAIFGRTLQTVAQSPRPTNYLGYFRDGNNDLWLKVLPDLLFLDFQKAIEQGGLPTRGLSFTYLTRQRGATPRRATVPGPYYQFDSLALETSLGQAGHQRI